MGITKEHLKILECYEYDDYTVKELKRILNISENRIRLYTLELLQYYQVTKLDELKIKVRTDKKWRKKLKNNLEIESKDRINFILISFLKKKIVNLNDISSILGVTRRTITKDLKEVKTLLKDFNLKYISLNSKGIELIGNEADKITLFNIILFNIFLEKKYLPNIFNVLLIDFNNFINEKIRKVVRERLKRKNVIEHIYVALNIEILIYLSIIKNFGVFDFIKAKYELKLMRELCKKNKIDNLKITYFNEFSKAKKFVEYINAKIDSNIQVSEKGYITLLTRFKLLEFKSKFNVKEMYMINRNFEKEHKEIYSILTNIIDEYFGYKIDSLDRISIILILKKYLYIQKKLQDKIKTENIIIYDTFQRLLLEEILESLELREIKIKSLVSEHVLKSYLLENKVKNILVFENIDFTEIFEGNKSINIIRMSFPLGEGDYLKIKKMLK